ncbi:MAG: hypothetical protein Q9187_003289 [Circinaria calcarea]
MDFLTSSEPFTMVDSPSSSAAYPHQVFTDYREMYSGKSSDLDLQITAALRRQYPSHVLTVTLEGNCNLLAFAGAGHATAFLDDATEPVVRWRGYVGNAVRGQPGQVGQQIRFAKYHYIWESVEFIVYNMRMGFSMFNYVLCEPLPGEKKETFSRITDELIKAVGEWQTSIEGFVFVFDSYWSRNRQLFEEVQKARWEDVILDEEIKKTLTELVGRFFDSTTALLPYKMEKEKLMESRQRRLRRPWSAVEARDNVPRSCGLYVKAAVGTYQLRNVFVMARRMAPCLLIFEDIDTIVTQSTRSYFFNEVDGLERNDGILMIASTNHLDALDPGLSKRPSRFDRKYLFPLPSEAERTLYCEYWRQKLKSNKSVSFPQFLCPAIAGITDRFSFAYMKEAFVATLLIMASNRSRSVARGGGPDGDDDDLDSYELWKEMKAQVKLLREDMDSSNPSKTVTDDHVGHEMPEDIPDDEDERTRFLQGKLGRTRDLPLRGRQSTIPFREQTTPSYNVSDGQSWAGWSF